MKQKFTKRNAVRKSFFFFLEIVINLENKFFFSKIVIKKNLWI